MPVQEWRPLPSKRAKRARREMIAKKKSLPLNSSKPNQKSNSPKTLRRMRLLLRFHLNPQ